ncbi:hypothetical protein FRC02_012415 [Tulasnella sp. 418]|nr:hypothetical protein FRC02_012415 [Tulasnella sp. 418]
MPKAERLTSSSTKRIKRYPKSNAPKLVHKCPTVTPASPANSNHATIHDLPVELLYEIMLFSKSPSLPLVSRHLHQVFSSTPTSYKVEYLLEVTNSISPERPSFRKVIEKWLSHPICDLSVLQALEKRYVHPVHNLTEELIKPHFRLPKLLFKNLKPSSGGSDPGTQVLPLLEYLYRKRSIQVTSIHLSPIMALLRGSPQAGEYEIIPIPLPDPDSRRGYPLIRAVYGRSSSLVQFLLDKHADPWAGGAMAIKVAVSQKNLQLVKQFLSCTSIRSPLSLGVGFEQEILDTAVRYNAREIVEYLMNEKNYVPDMKTVQLLMRS